MEYVTPLLLVIVLGAVAFLILKSGRPAEAGTDPANAALLEETRRQLAAVNAALTQERATLICLLRAPKLSGYRRN